LLIGNCISWLLLQLALSQKLITCSIDQYSEKCFLIPISDKQQKAGFY